MSPHFLDLLSFYEGDIFSSFWDHYYSLENSVTKAKSLRFSSDIEGIYLFCWYKNKEMTRKKSFFDVFRMILRKS
jgi:hypothetical protein